MLPLRFEAFDQLAGRPHVVVDGSGVAGTAMTLSHWPGSPTPPAVIDDLSALIAFHALDHPDWFDGIELVSNNHFDQDGLVSAWVLIDPEAATARQELAVDLARAGDFCTWAHRQSVRLAIAIAAYSDPARSPLGAGLHDLPHPERSALLYRTLLPMLPDLLDDPSSVEHLWAAEDAVVQAGLDGLARGSVTIEEHADHDLAVVTVPETWASASISRFTMARAAVIHPLALHNATDRMVVLIVHGDAVRLEQRYETWVMHPSRPLPPRQDLRDLAALLSARDAVGWEGESPEALTPLLATPAGSTLPVADVLAITEDFLATAPPAWDPYASS